MSALALNWPGKANALKRAFEPSAYHLKWMGKASPYRCIFHDNLIAMKAMKHNGVQVNVIYIDPPYNTGQQFVYTDHFQNSTEVVSGDKHSAWLSMMLPRLILAKELLREDGVIFISIDHHEHARLQLIMDEIFNEKNRCGTFIWERKKKPSYLSKTIVNRTEYILAYAKNIKRCPIFSVEKTQANKRRPFNNLSNKTGTLILPSNSVCFRMPDQLVPAQNMSTPNVPCFLLDDVQIKGGRNTDPFRIQGQWRYSQSALDAMIEQGDDITVSKIPFRLNVSSVNTKPKPTGNLLTIKDSGMATYEDAAKEITDIFGFKAFDYPKPKALLSHLLSMVMPKDGIALDFFAGTGTLGHVVIDLNQQDDGTRRFVCIQECVSPSIDSLAYKNGVKSISDLCLTRLNWALEKHPKNDFGIQLGRLE